MGPGRFFQLDRRHNSPSVLHFSHVHAASYGLRWWRLPPHPLPTLPAAAKCVGISNELQIDGGISAAYLICLVKATRCRRQREGRRVAVRVPAVILRHNSWVCVCECVCGKGLSKCCCYGHKKNSHIALFNRLINCTIVKTIDKRQYV